MQMNFDCELKKTCISTYWLSKSDKCIYWLYFVIFLISYNYTFSLQYCILVITRKNIFRINLPSCSVRKWIMLLGSLLPRAFSAYTRNWQKVIGVRFLTITLDSEPPTVTLRVCCCHLSARKESKVIDIFPNKIIFLIKVTRILIITCRLANNDLKFDKK